MKLSDKKFISKKADKTADYTKVDADSIRNAVGGMFAIEAAFDAIMAQAGGPNMLGDQGDPDFANPSEVADVSDVWPEHDVVRQVSDLKNQGLQEGPILQQLIEMGVLGTDHPLPDQVEQLNTIIKRTSEKIAQKQSIQEKLKKLKEREEKLKLEKEKRETEPQKDKLDAPEAPPKPRSLEHLPPEQQMKMLSPEPFTTIPQSKSIPEPGKGVPSVRPVYKPSGMGPADYMIFSDGTRAHKLFLAPDPSDVNPTELKMWHSWSGHDFDKDPDVAVPAGKEVVTSKEQADALVKKWVFTQSNVGGKHTDYTKREKKEPAKPAGDVNPATDPMGELREMTKDWPIAKKMQMLESFRAKVALEHTTLNDVEKELSDIVHDRPRAISGKQYTEMLNALRRAKPGEDRQQVLEKYTKIYQSAALKKIDSLYKKYGEAKSEQEQRQIASELEKSFALMDKERPLFSGGSTLATKNALMRKVNALQVKMSKYGRLWLKLVNALGLKDQVKNPKFVDYATSVTQGQEPGQGPDQESQSDDELLSDIKKLEIPMEKKQSKSAGGFGASPSGDYFKVKVTHDSGSSASPVELSGLLKSLGTSGIVEAVDPVAGIFKVDLPEELEHKLIMDGKFKVVLDKFTLESIDGDGPTDVDASTADFPVGQRDSISKEEVQGTGKIGQAAPPPQEPPQAPPAQPADPSQVTDMMDSMDGGPQDEPEDDRPMAEIIEQIKTDVDSLAGKIEGGDTMMGGEEFEPVKSDSGAIPMPGPQKVAVDEYAKDYYSDLYGDYGVALAKDRVAEIVDSIEKTSAAFNIRLSDADITKIVGFVADDVSGDSFYNDVMDAARYNTKLASVVDEVMIKYILANPSRIAMLDSSIKPSMFVLALDNSMFDKISFIVKAQRMKTPSINKKHTDAVDVEEIGDNAEAKEQPSHVKFCVEDSSIRGKYMFIELSWDEQDERSESSMRHMIKSFVKGLESRKEFNDIGVLGQPEIVELDMDACVATVKVVASKPGEAVPTVDTK